MNGANAPGPSRAGLLRHLGAPSLFWRTFLLILLLLAVSSLAWLQSFRVFEREPRAQQLAEQVISIVNITRSALLYSDPIVRLVLLADLADNQGIRIVPLEATDKVRAFPDRRWFAGLPSASLQALGPNTRIAAEVNGVEGIWVSFSIDTDEYWVFIERDPLARKHRYAVGRLGADCRLASLLAAVAITRVVNGPLARLSRAARELGAGRSPESLPERGPTEIATVNASFNRMVSDLAQTRARPCVASGRYFARPAHAADPTATRSGNQRPARRGTRQYGRRSRADGPDRCPVSRLRTHRTGSTEERRRPVGASSSRQSRPVDSNATETVASSGESTPASHINGLSVELARALANLLTNAERYGRDPDSGRLELEVVLHTMPQAVILEIADRGPGVAADRLEHLVRPFVRGENARSGVAGAGLGLAIVERITRLHGGSLRLRLNAPSGLRAELQLPRASHPA